MSLLCIYVVTPMPTTKAVARFGWSLSAILSGSRSIEMESRSARKKILLVDPGRVSESWYVVREMPSLALGCLATYLRELRHEVKIIDMATYKVDNRGLQAEIARFQPDVLGITSATFNVCSAFEVAQSAKNTKPDVFVVLGGAHASALPRHTLEECSSIDAIVVGEGERALAWLCENFETGIIRKHPIENLDELPMVDWTLYNLMRYKKFYSARFDKELHKFTLSIVRGCPFPCKFCFKVFKGAARSRSPENVFREIVYNYERLGARLFYVADSTLLLFKENIHELCRMIIRSKLEIALIVQSRADTIDRESVDLLKQAGCETFFVGVESGNDDILQRAGKGITKDQVRHAVRILHEARVPRIRCSFIVGLEGDTRETIAETIAFAIELKGYGMNRASVHCLDIYPKTPYWNMVERGEGNLRPRTHLHDWLTFSRLYPMTICGDISTDELKSFRDSAKEHFQEEF